MAKEAMVLACPQSRGPPPWVALVDMGGGADLLTALDNPGAPYLGASLELAGQDVLGPFPVMEMNLSACPKLTAWPVVWL